MVKRKSELLIVLIGIFIIISNSVAAQIHIDTTSVRLYAFFEKDTININDSVLITFEIENITDTVINFCLYHPNILISHRGDLFDGKNGFGSLGKGFEEVSLNAKSFMVREMKIKVSDWFYLNENEFVFLFFSRCTVNTIFAHTDTMTIYVK